MNRKRVHRKNVSAPTPDIQEDEPKQNVFVHFDDDDDDDDSKTRVSMKEPLPSFVPM